MFDCSAAAAAAAEEEARVRREMESFEQQLGGKAQPVNVRVAFGAAGMYNPIGLFRPLVISSFLQFAVTDASEAPPARTGTEDVLALADSLLASSAAAGLSFADGSSSDSDDG